MAEKSQVNGKMGDVTLFCYYDAHCSETGVCGVAVRDGLFEGDRAGGEPTVLVRAVLACVVHALILFNVWLMNNTTYPALTEFFGVARDISTLLGPLISLALVPLALRIPRVFADRCAYVVAAALLVASTAALLIGVSLNDPVLSTVGVCFSTLSSVYTGLCCALLLVELPGWTCLIVLALASMAKYLLMIVFSGAAEPLLWVLEVTLPFVVFALAVWLSRGAFARIAAAGPSADLTITNPRSFVPFTSLLFVTELMFRAALGFVLTYGATGGVPQPMAFSFAAVGAVALLVLVRHITSSDTLYCVAFGLVLAGVLLVLVPGEPLAPVGSAANVLLQAGSDVFGLAMTYLISRINARSLAGALPLLLVDGVFNGAGTELGALGGHVTTYLEGVAPACAPLVVVAIALVFALYNFVVRGRFSFDRTLAEVEPLAVALGTTGSAADGPGATCLEAVCEAMAREAHLTAREAQVLTLLARGRNVAYIQQELGLSRNTIKTYVAGVYGKLNVHSHQELIDLVERDGAPAPVQA